MFDIMELMRNELVSVVNLMSCSVLLFNNFSNNHNIRHASLFIYIYFTVYMIYCTDDFIVLYN